MKSFKKTIKRRIIWVISCALIFDAAVATALVLKFTTDFEAGGILSTEWIAGAFFGANVAAVFRLKPLLKALKDKEYLEELHIRETDERNRSIILNTCRSTVAIFSTMIGIAGITAAFFNIGTATVIGLVLIVFLIVYFSLYFYFSKKY